LLFHIAGALAQFERRLNAERSRAGIEAARRRGKHLGRPELTPEKIAHARKAIDSYGRQVWHKIECWKVTGCFSPDSANSPAVSMIRS
jgi:DNA invertase Pin-like site-specific DNA recombinase